MTPTYPNMFIDSLEKGTLSNSLLKPSGWWPYIDDAFMVCDHEEEELKSF